MLKRLPIVAAVAAVLCLGSAVGSAQEPGRGATVTERSRPELDPLGLRLGGFLVYPRLVVGERFDDNIFAVDNNRDSDFITTVTPEVRIRSDWNNHALNFEANGTFGYYRSQTSENYEDLHVGIGGRLDITRNTKLSGNARYQRLHEERSSPDDQQGREPTEFSLSNFLVSFFHRFNRLSVRLSGSGDIYDYDDVQTLTGTVNEDDRDRKVLEATARVGYEIVPDYEAFVRGSTNARLYDDNVDDLGLNRDSVGYEVVLGTAIDFSGITFGDVFVGYTVQDFDDGALPRVEGLTFGGKVTWNVTRRSTLTGSVTRTIEETTSSQASGRFTTRAGITADHELLRNLLLNARVSATKRDFEGIDREETDLNAGLGVKYMMNRHLYVSLDYDLRTRKTDQFGSGGREFLVNSGMLRIQAQF